MSTNQDAPSAERPLLRFRSGAHKRVARGHPWAYSNEIVMDAAAKALPAGTVVRLARHDGMALGTATFNPHTLIAARVLSPDPAVAVDTAFLAARIERALRLRQRLVLQPYYRLVHAEADGLPGLIIDRFGEVAVVQANTAGMDRLLPAVIEALETAFPPRAVVLRNDAPARALEGLESRIECVKGSLDGPVEVHEGGVVFLADPMGGQKTGWFCDQRDNRAFMAGLAEGARVLDLYCYGGSFAVTCAKAGAAQVLGVDRAQAALDLAAAAAARNGVDGRCSFRREQVFDALERLVAAGERFDVVIADPPAFVKSRKDLAPGLKGYRRLARLAAQTTAPEGFLFIASCSHNVTAEAFAQEVARGVGDAGRIARIVRTAGAAPDHPVHPLLPETAYLKALVLALD